MPGTLASELPDCSESIKFPLALKWRRLTNRKATMPVVWNYLQATSFASFINATTFYLMCMARRYNSRFMFIFTPYLSCWLASQLSWWMPPQVLLYFVSGITHAALETLMRYFNVPLVHSRLDQTLVFMICSLIAIHYQQANKYSGFWFIRPVPLHKDYQKWTMIQRLRDSLKEISTYMGVGLVLDLVNPIRKRSLKSLRLKSTTFLVGYIGIFKLLQSLFLGRFNLKHSNAFAAFLSGSAFASLNRLTFMCFAVVTASQVIWLQVCSKDPKQDTRLATIQRIPWSKLLIPCCLAYLVHIFFFHSHHLNDLARDFIDFTCDKNGQRLLDLMKLPDVNMIMTKVNSSPKTSFWY
ncbi:uncharacterized protein LOC26515521 isoform X3 [Drosophila ananassae]|uniref:uncharacterized protein LOC26515521 isoform X3 n=1 Tax=Drosophila ananassae TaxID=7217 RepID=UPI001D001492|nr:uncharacterized protein LOC26515521 isoform X3 [Drosophila ananassae]